ncbi:hypothetical protein OBE_01040, partial [human gut metagenome]
TVDPGAAFAGNIHYLPLQNEAAWADSIAAADLTRDPNAQAKAIAAGFDVHTSAGILQKFLTWSRRRNIQRRCSHE